MINPLGPTRAQAVAARTPPMAAADQRAVATPPPPSATPYRLADEVRALLAEPAPIDGARVARLRAALADGRFRIDPAQIAAAMILSEQAAADAL